MVLFPHVPVFHQPTRGCKKRKSFLQKRVDVVSYSYTEKSRCNNKLEEQYRQYHISNCKTASIISQFGRLIVEISVIHPSLGYEQDKKVYAVNEDEYRNRPSSSHRKRQQMVGTAKPTGSLGQMCMVDANKRYF